jgi:hypothetical protein
LFEKKKKGERKKKSMATRPYHISFYHIIFVKYYKYLWDVWSLDLPREGFLKGREMNLKVEFKSIKKINVTCTLTFTKRALLR